MGRQWAKVWYEQCVTFFTFTVFWHRMYILIGIVKVCMKLLLAYIIIRYIGNIQIGEKNHMIGFIYRIAGVYIWTVTKFGGLHLGTVIISGTHEIWHKEKKCGVYINFDVKCQ